jgi:hypothetical protein
LAEAREAEAREAEAREAEAREAEAGERWVFGQPRFHEKSVNRRLGFLN